MEESAMEEEKPHFYSMYDKLNDIIAERNMISPDNFPNLCEVIDKQIKLIASGQDSFKLINLHSMKPMKIIHKIRIPLDKFPEVNFVGRIVGQRGRNINFFKEELKCRLGVYGKGSIKDEEKEERLRLEGGFNNHFNHDQHVVIEAFASPLIAYQRTARAMTFLQPMLRHKYEEEDDLIGKYLKKKQFIGMDTQPRAIYQQPRTIYPQRRERLEGGYSGIPRAVPLREFDGRHRGGRVVRRVIIPARQTHYEYEDEFLDEFEEPEYYSEEYVEEYDPTITTFYEDVERGERNKGPLLKYSGTRILSYNDRMEGSERTKTPGKLPRGGTVMKGVQRSKPY